MFTGTPLSRRSLVTATAILLVLALGISAVVGQQLVQKDGRLNQVTHFGGDALYCIDEASNVTNNSATFDHFLLLDKDGQPLWTLSRQIVEEGLGQICSGGWQFCWALGRVRMVRLRCMETPPTMAARTSSLSGTTNTGKKTA